MSTPKLLGWIRNAKDPKSSGRSPTWPTTSRCRSRSSRTGGAGGTIGCQSLTSRCAADLCGARKPSRAFSAIRFDERGGSGDREDSPGRGSLCLLARKLVDDDVFVADVFKDLDQLARLGLGHAFLSVDLDADSHLPSPSISAARYDTPCQAAGSARAMG